MRGPWKYTAIVLFALCLVFWSLVGNRLLALTDEAHDLLRLYTEMVHVVHEQYGGNVTYEDLVHSSIGGMLRTLDPHTNFLAPRAYDTMRERQQTSFYGLGILVGMRNGQLTVITPIEGTPASRLGLRAGDVIAAIEGESTETLSLDEAVRRLKGPKGTDVQITVVRRGLEEPIPLSITRAEIPQTTVRHPYMLNEETAYMSITDFNRGTGREVEVALDDLRAQGMKSLVLDLRGNGGGLLDQAIEVAEQFLPDGAKIVETRGRTRDSFQDFSAAAVEAGLEVPVVVLVGEGTASAAEILAGAIQDHDVGLIVGTPTWGKGLVQTVYSLSYGAGIALTTAKYYTPSGRLIQRDYTSYFDYQSNDAAPSVAEVNEVFLTDLGREVYGGGGITPDIKIEPGKIDQLLQYLLGRGTFFDFGVDYSRSHEIENREWTPPADLIAEFRQWLVAEDHATEEEIGEAFDNADTREIVERRLHAEIFNSVFGNEARYQILANGDPQIRKAVEVLGQAQELRARRRELEENPGIAPIEAVGP